MNKPRKTWIAILFTFFTIGLGHIYCGKLSRGIYFFILGQIVVVLAFFLLIFSPPYGVLLAIFLAVFIFLFFLADVYKISKELPATYELKQYNKWYVYLILVAIASFLIQPLNESLVKKYISQAFNIPSGAMLNTLQIGDHIICNKLIYKITTPKRGDVVIFPYPKDPSVSYVKRIVGVGGETVEIRNKKVLIDGREVNEKYAIHKSDRVFPAGSNPRDNFGPVNIPLGSVFLMGDNRDNSHDSRFWGFVKTSEIEGKVHYVYWSWDPEKSRIKWKRIGHKIE